MLEEDIQDRLVSGLIDEFFNQNRTLYYFDSTDFIFQMSPLVHIYKAYLQYCLELAIKDQTHELKNIFHKFFENYEPNMRDYMVLRRMYEDDWGGSPLGSPTSYYEINSSMETSYDTDFDTD